MSARDRMLARIRERQGKSPHASAEEIETVRSELASRSVNAAPRDPWDPPQRFTQRALSLASTIEEAASLTEVPERISAYLRLRDLPLKAVCWPELAELDWVAAGIAVEVRPATGDDLVGITGAYCAISETGTLMTISGADTPPTVSLLPETHIAVVRRERIVRSMEDAWTLLRAGGSIPRAISFISGPSRTADIEQTVTLGAHGPYRVHIVVVA